MKVFYNGELVEKEQVIIDPFSASVLYGVTVFEGIRYYLDHSQKVLVGFRLYEHYTRFLHSIKILNINFSISFDEFINSIEKTILANGYKEDLYVRTSLILDKEGTWHSVDNARLLVSVFPRVSNLDLSRNGVRTSISHWNRISDSQMPPRTKVGSNYLNSRMAYLEAKNKGFDNAILLNKDGYVAEGPGACVFIVRDNVLITPSINQSILESITRDTIIKIAKDLNLQVIERPVDRTELFICDEVFYTGTAAEITPIIQVDSYLIGESVPGPITITLLKEFNRITRGQNSKYQSWLTKVHV